MAHEETVEALQQALVLLKTSMAEANNFLGTWHEKYLGVEENYAEFRRLTKQLNDDLHVASKELKNWRDLSDVMRTSKELLAVSNKMHEIITGPLVIIQAARNLAAISEHVSKLMARAMPTRNDDDDLFDSLQPDQITQIYQWIAENATR